IIQIAEDLGYNVEWDIVNSKNYEVPQKRKRVIFIGSKSKIEGAFENDKNKTVTVRKAINDLPKVKNGNRKDILEYSKNKNLSEYQKSMRNNGSSKVSNNKVTKNGELVRKRYKHIPPGGNWENIPDRLMKNYEDPSRCHSGIYHRLRWDEPSIVISNFRKNMLIHPEENRGLSVREAARLQSFPDNYIFKGPISSQQQQVANAVPPILAREIGKKIKNCNSRRKNE
ncbi:MAG: DNA cytosine methyltransferase, partial [archaeon]